MCLGVPGQITAAPPVDDPLQRVGTVSFGGILKEVCLAYVPEAAVGDWVVVHAGFGIAVVDEAAAAATLALLDELEAPAPTGEAPP